MFHPSSVRKRRVILLMAWAPAFTKLAVGCAASATGSLPDPGGAGAAAGGVSNAAGSSAAGTIDAGGAAHSGGATSSSAGAANVGGASGAAAHGGASAGGTSSGGSSSAGASNAGSGGKCNTSGPAGQLFLDSFEDGELAKCPSWIDADPTLGGMWSVKADGDSKVLAQGAAVSDWVINVSGSYTTTDQVVSAKVKFTSEPGSLGIFARVQDSRNYYFLYLDGSNIVLRGRVDNSQLTSVKVKTPTIKDTWYTLKLSVIGSTLTGYLNDMQLVTTTDASLKSGGVGVGTADSATAEFDDVTVTAM
jgi:hypothetical protein